MNCAYFEECISATLDGEITRRESEELRLHLQTCRRCREYYAALIAVTEAMDTDLVAPPKELCANIMAAVKAEPTPVTVLSVKKPQHRLIRFGALAASLLIIAGLGAAASRRRGAETPMMMAAPAAASESYMTADEPAEAKNEGLSVELSEAKNDWIPAESAAEEPELPAETASGSGLMLFAGSAPAPEEAASADSAENDAFDRSDEETANISMLSGEYSGQDAGNSNGMFFPETAAAEYLYQSRPELYERVDWEKPPLIASATPRADGEEGGCWSVTYTLTDGTTVTLIVDENGEVRDVTG